MEQRVLLASALVLGCLTAAGAGGYIAARQMAAPAAEVPAGQVAAALETRTPDPTQGTVADIVPAVEAPVPSAEPAPVAAREPVAARPSSSSTKPAVRASTPPTAAPTSPTASPRPATASARSAPVPATRRPGATPGPAPRETAVTPGTSVPEQTTAPSQDTARPEAAPRDTWPSRDTTSSRDSSQADDRWPSRDRDADSTTADASVPSRAPANDPAPLPAPARRLESVTIPANAVIGIQVENGVSTTTARVEDPVRARVTRDLLSGGDVVIPAGSRLLGNVTLVEEGGRVKERSRLGIRFHTLVLANGTEIRLPTETVYRDGESPAGRSAAKIGGSAIGGAILGAIMGGGKGAVIGAATGAGSGTGWAMAGDRKPAELRAGQSLTVRVSDAVTTQVER